MSPLELQESVEKLLQNLKSLDVLKKLFWSQLNYERDNKTLSRRKWTERVANQLEEDPLLLASGGTNNDFHVIYARLKSDHLSRDGERLVVNRLLQNHPYALFVFSNQAQSRWHFLNVKNDTTPERQKLFRRITVEAGEPLRTATEQLSLLDLESINRDPLNASLLTIQERHDDAFDVEVVTKKFFEQYALVFGRVERLIQGISDLERRRLFTQKLFNRLMFIAFIQKKGWLKFNGQTDYLSALWKAYEHDSSTSNKNFYRDRLSRLFFLGLNNQSQVDITGINRNFSSTNPFDIGTVPYLNGGLFEQDEDDDDTQILVPDECINTIFHDLFKRFAFTVTESTPLDVEVAVDPEMLGKIFEELVTGRHDSGRYYTPKPIVSFMCREALKGYLKTQVSGEQTDTIEQFVDEHNPAKLSNPEATLEALRQVRTCDLAAGSGAYLLEILHELLDLRQCLFATKGLDSKTVYQRKLEIIENNLYGVDIDHFAVNIARLRLWLSLAVEYEGDDPPPLPNLKFKIEQGDSLIAPSPTGIGAIRDELIRQYRETKARYMRAHLGGEKKKLEAEISGIKTQIALMTHGSSKVSGFDWAVEFAEVFADGGFDIVVANPPYVRMELFKEIKPTLRKNFPEVHSDRADLYCYFYGRALQLLRNGGMLAFISSNKWFRAKYGEKLRKHIAETCKVYNITNFGDLPVFQSAIAYPMIFIGQNGKIANISSVFTQVKSLNTPYPDVLKIIQQSGNILSSDALRGSNWTLTDTASAKRLQKMEAAGVTLAEYVKGQIYWGVKTGFNRAFYIDGAKRAELITQNPKSVDIIKPLVVGDNVRKWKTEFKNKYLLYMYHGIDITSLDAVLAHLRPYRQQLENRATRQERYELQQPQLQYMSTFTKAKIIYPEIAKESRFTLDTQKLFPNNKAFIIPVNDLYLLGVLNSAPIWEYLKSLCSGLRGKTLELRSIYMNKIPIPNASNIEQKTISKLVQKCLDAKGVACEAWEREIDERVAALYGL